MIGERRTPLSSSAHFSCLGAVEYFIKLDCNQEIDMSRLFLYYNARLRNPQYQYYMEDKGCYIGDAMNSLQIQGVCKEADWPFQHYLINYQPRSDCYSKVYRSSDIQTVRLPNDLNAMKSSLVEGYPIAVGLLLFRSFYSAEWNGGWVSIPNQSEGQLEQHGAFVVDFPFASEKRHRECVRFLDTRCSLWATTTGIEFLSRETLGVNTG